jgi:His-Xaa-Ser system radical SAM maturase HxsC
LSTEPALPATLKKQKGFVTTSKEVLPKGFAHYFIGAGYSLPVQEGLSLTHLTEDFAYLGNNDVVQVTPEGNLRTLYRDGSLHNSILLTEQCNNYCLMCSQPPKRKDDTWVLEEIMALIPLIPRTAQCLVISGGEPTLRGDGLIELLKLCKNRLPHTAIHLLSNGRNFADNAVAKKFADVQHPDLMVGIPVYSDDPARHDYVVQAVGAFDETIRGILNLKRLNQKVEIRVVIHKQTYERLPQLAEFISRNLLFVDQVALMGLEMMGFARANIEALWIDPVEYKDQLSEAVKVLTGYGIRTSVYNSQLCLINPDVEPSYVKSISDWKNEYAPECETCCRKAECGGFFASGVKYKYSPSLRPFTRQA